MGSHEAYAANLLRRIFGERWKAGGIACIVSEGAVSARLDGVILSANLENVECAVEIEARVFKQMRGALVDLALHGARKKLLVVMLAQRPVNDPERTENHLRHVWNHICPSEHEAFEVVVLGGTHISPKEEIDMNLLKRGLTRLGLTSQRVEARPPQPVMSTTPTPTPKTKADFVEALSRKFHEAESTGAAFVDLRAGDLHKQLGGPNRMPACCLAMRSMMREGDEVLHQPPKGNGPNLRIRYRLPRQD